MRKSKTKSNPKATLPAKYRGLIPDLREDTDQITIDHCYVLLQRLSQALDSMDGTEGQFAELVENFNPVLIQQDLQQYLDALSFSRLFKNEFGKGVLVGFYAKELWIKWKGQPDAET